jgi:riboflavin kinase/FMN adenylyltransferase
VSPVRVNYDLGSLPGDGVKRAVTIGKFDGVHRGHLQVINQLCDMAGETEATVITFDRHPHVTLRSGVAPLPVVSETQKVELLSDAGVARVVVLPFDKELSSLGHEEFSRVVLAEGLSASVVLVGGDFRYGHGGSGSIATLRSEGERWGFRVEVVADVCQEEGERVSSTMIRTLLGNGEVAAAARLLGRLHAVRGEVAPGAQRGRTLGYPTANLEQPLEGLTPADGVYATYVTHQGVRYPAATSVGINPTFGELTQSVVESHLMDASLDLYGETIQVEFVDYIRGMRKFPSAEELGAQMSADETAIRAVLEGAQQA